MYFLYLKQTRTATEIRVYGSGGLTRSLGCSRVLNKILYWWDVESPKWKGQSEARCCYEDMIWSYGDQEPVHAVRATATHSIFLL